MTIAEINKMNIHEKLQAMENLWNSLIADESEIESPEWHKEILEQRLNKIENGTAKFISLSELKTKIV